MPDLFLVTGCLDDLQETVKQLNTAIMKGAKEDIDWKNVTDLAYRIGDVAEMLIDESEGEG